MAVCIEQKWFRRFMHLVLYRSSYSSSKHLNCSIDWNGDIAKWDGRSVPHRAPRGEWIAQYRPAMSFGFYSTLYLRNHLYFWSLTVLEKSKRIHWTWRQIASTRLNLSLWWRHNIYLWRHNSASRHARAKHYEYFMLKNCTQTTLVYWSKNLIELLYIYTC